MSTESCARCGATEGVEFEDSRTCYPRHEDGTDPNAPVPLCRSCAKDHHDYWDERWDEYRSGLL